MNPTTYMKSYWLLSFVGHYVPIFHHMIKEINLVKDHYWNVHQNNQANGRGRTTPQNSPYSKRSTCFTFNIITLSLVSIIVLQTPKVAPSETTVELEI